MLDAFRTYIKNEKLFLPADKILLAISGGIDSVVMLELFHQAVSNFGVVHVNFKLRGEESDADEKFVKNLAEKYQVPFYSATFDTTSYATEKKLSIQMAARELRYKYFEEIRKKFGYQYIATAHHKDDQVETFFINLLRGTGISGLRGILPKQNFLIRPMLFSQRKEIEKFVVKNKLSYREDSSNASDKYLRNKIRHKLMPMLEELDENYLDLLNANMRRFGDSEQIYKNYIGKVKTEIQSEKAGKIYLSIEKLKAYSPVVTFLYELLKPYNFIFSQAEDIVQVLDYDAGKMFYSASHELLKDRDHLILREKRAADKDNPIIYVNESDNQIESPVSIKFKKIDRDKHFVIPTENSVAVLDYNKLTFPLTIRKWNPGDIFYPLGSSYKKKLSDFFIDRKFNLFEKKSTYLLCSGDDIVWIIGHQIDDRYKLTDKSKKIFKAEYLPIA